MMGSLISENRNIESLRLDDFPKKKVLDVKVYREKDTLLFSDGKKLYVARQINTAGWAFPITFTSWAWQEDFFRAAQKLGFLTKEAVDDEIKKTKEKDRLNKIKSLEKSIFEDTQALALLKDKTK
jgi:hypothetical protein